MVGHKQPLGAACPPLAPRGDSTVVPPSENRPEKRVTGPVTLECILGPVHLQILPPSKRE